MLSRLVHQLALFVDGLRHCLVFRTISCRVGLTVHTGLHSVWLDLTVSVPRLGYHARQVVRWAKFGTTTPHMPDKPPCGDSTTVSSPPQYQPL
jgi:hypothetical protein